MAKKKEPTVRDIISKLERYYKDVYIIHQSCFCGGPTSEKVNRGYYFGFFMEPAKTVLKNTYQRHPEEDLILITDVRLMKDNPTEHCKYFTDIDTIEDVQVKYSDLYNKVREITNWEPLNLPEEGIQAIFKNGDSYDFRVDPSVPEVTFTKTLFPGMTHTSVPSVLYAFKKYTSPEMGEVMDLYFQFPLEQFFTMFMIYTVMI